MGRSRTTCREDGRFGFLSRVSPRTVVAPPVLPGDRDGTVKPAKQGDVIANAI